MKKANVATTLCASTAVVNAAEKNDMNAFSLLVKPCGADCNLACEYCFYRGHAPGRMSPEVLERIMETYSALPFEGKAVAFQGGEPTLAGLDFFRRVQGYPVDKSLQTNATLVTDEWAEFLAAGHWLVGASVDGPPEVHNRFRGAYAATEAGIRRMERAGVDYNLLTVVSKSNVAEPVRVYRYLRDNFSTRFHQYIECTGPRHEINAAEWGSFLCGLFDEWAKADSRTLSVRLFDSIVAQMVVGHATQCSFGASCRQYLVVEHDGSVYPCDFHVREDLRLGNIMEDSWEKIVSSVAYKRFAARKLENLPKECRSCAHYRWCHGDCPRNRNAGRPVLCAGWKRFFDHAIPVLEGIVRSL